MGLVSTITRWFRGRNEEPAAAPVVTPAPLPVARVEPLPLKPRETDIELRNAKERLAQSDRKLADAESKSAAAQRNVSELKEKLAAAEAKLKTAEQSASELRQKLAAAESKSAASEKPLGELRDKLAAAEKSVSELREKLSASASKLAASEKSATELRVRLTEAESKLTRSEKTTGDLRAQLATAQSTSSDDEKLASTEAIVADLRSKLESAEARLQMTERELAQTRDDLAREKDAETSEHDARTEAERVSEAKDQFLAVVSHEMRTPLTSILGWASMLATEQVGKDTKEVAVQRLLESAREEARIIDDLLDFSRMVAGRLSFAGSEVDLVSVLRSVIANQQLTAESRNVRLELHAPADMIVWGDRVRLRQIFGNLVANAIKFTPDNGSIDVTASADDTSARVVVSDTGRGIAPEFLPYVFDWFTQEEAPMQRTSAGMGLGLAIVRQLVELHRGTATAASEGTGRGATFTVTIPLLGRSKEATP